MTRNEPSGNRGSTAVSSFLSDVSVVGAPAVQFFPICLAEKVSIFQQLFFFFFFFPFFLFLFFFSFFFFSSVMATSMCVPSSIRQTLWTCGKRCRRGRLYCGQCASLVVFSFSSFSFSSFPIIDAVKIAPGVFFVASGLTRGQRRVVLASLPFFFFSRTVFSTGVFSPCFILLSCLYTSLWSDLFSLSFPSSPFSFLFVNFLSLFSSLSLSYKLVPFSLSILLLFSPADTFCAHPVSGSTASFSLYYHILLSGSYTHPRLLAILTTRYGLKRLPFKKSVKPTA